MPTSIYDSRVERYLRKRFPTGSASRRRCIREAIPDLHRHGRRGQVLPTSSRHLNSQRMPCMRRRFTRLFKVPARPPGCFYADNQETGFQLTIVTRYLKFAMGLPLGKTFRLLPCGRSLQPSCLIGNPRRGSPMPVPFGPSIAALPQGLVRAGPFGCRAICTAIPTGRNSRHLDGE